MKPKSWYMRGPLWRLRIWRWYWPHNIHSIGHHRWRDQGVIDARRVFVCDRCGGSVSCWPLNVESPLLHYGDRVVFR